MTSSSRDQNIEREELLRLIRRVNGVARMMDTALRVPGTNIRFGADSVMGLLPGIGDAGGALVGLFIVNEARRLGIPKAKIATMLYNLGVDAAVGAVPLLGDMFDVYFKSHKRNVQLIRDHFGVSDEELNGSRRRR